MTGPSPGKARVLALGLLSIGAIFSACSSTSSSSDTNGESTKSPSQIFTDAKHATSSASSVHISGDITSGSDNIALDVVDSSGRSGGSITENGATVQVILSGKTIYLMGNAASMAKFAGSAAAGQLLGGKWLQTSKDNKDFGSLAQLFDLGNLVQAIQPKGTVHKGTVTTVNGQSAIPLTDSSGNGTLYIANTGRPYMVEVKGGSKQSGTIKFDQYESAKPPAVPTGAVNLDQLQNG